MKFYLTCNTNILGYSYIGDRCNDTFFHILCRKLDP